MSKIVLKSKFMKDELDLPWSAIESNIIDQNRWSTFYEIVFEYDGKFYMAEYSQGSTEMQDESPWEYEDEVECVEVVRKPVVVMQWVVKEEE